MKLPRSLVFALKASVVCSAICGTGAVLVNANAEDSAKPEIKESPTPSPTISPTQPSPQHLDSCPACGMG